MKKVIGIDLGGTSIYGGLIDPNGNILGRSIRDTQDGKGKEEVLRLIGDVIDELVDEDVISIAIGSPGFINSEEGKVLHTGGNINDWANTDIRGELSRRFPKIPIYVENDANVAALCEHWIGAGSDFESFVMLTLGTGVGGAIYTKKEGILKGHGYQGGELGHAILYPRGIKCICGQRGCVERYISGSGVENAYSKITGEVKKGKDIFKDSLRDRVAKDVIDRFCQDLAIYIVSIKNTFDPEGVIIGGGVINSKDYWWDKMLEYYKEYSNDLGSMKIVPAEYLNDAGMIGAGQIGFMKEDR